jgi:hypothetical protein
MRGLFRLIPAALLGVGAAVLVSCGSSGKGLIPLRYAGPLQSDFQAVLQAAREGDGSCVATAAAIRKTEHDLRNLPASVDSGLRGRLSEGVANLSASARQLCAQPLAQTGTGTQTTSTAKTAPPPTTTSETRSTPTTEEAAPPPTATTPGGAPSPPSGEGGGTQAPGTGSEEGHGQEDNEGGPRSSGEAGGDATGGTGSGQ